MGNPFGIPGEATAPPPGSSIHKLIEAYATARRIREEAAARLKQLQAVEDRATSDLFDALEGQGLRSVKHETLGTFSLNDLAWPSISDPDKAREWAAIARPDLITLNQQRLAVVVREALRGEGEMPPGVDFRTSRKINWRGGPKEDGDGSE